MLSRLQELRKEEETLLRVKAALHDQLHRLKVEELALQSMIKENEGTVPVSSAAEMEEEQNMDNEEAINQTKLQLQMCVSEEEEEEEEESDS
ncbi:snRNA-activating protein complex subunit 5 [Anolis sagrei]|uniref:snRNA-activating protein complex subunit 5 n=1 Tax=Anolis sagrei TaxID=38937 RepID=UPI00351F9CC4